MRIIHNGFGYNGLPADYATDPLKEISDGASHLNSKWGNSSAPRFRQVVAEKLAPILALMGISTIGLSCPHADTHPRARLGADGLDGHPLPEGVFQIMIWTAPKPQSRESRGSAPYNRGPVFGKTYRTGGEVCGDAFYTPVDDDALTNIMTPEGYCMGQFSIQHRVMWLFGDLCHHGSSLELELFGHILDVATAEINAIIPGDADDRAAALERVKEEARQREYEQARRQFADALKSSVTNELESMKARIDSCNRLIRDYKAELVNHVRSLENAMRQVPALEAKLAELEAQADKELAAIHKIHGIVDVKLINTGGSLNVHLFTDTLYTRAYGRKFLMGRYRIELNIGNSGVKFFNLDPENQRHGFWGNDHHPHVSEGGNPCLGNISETVAMLCGQYEIAALAGVLVNWLESVNVSDPAGAKVIHWDVIDDDGKNLGPGSGLGLGRSDDDDDGNYYDCVACGEDFNMDDGGGNCDECGEPVCEDCEVSVMGGERYVCPECRDRHYVYCESCEECRPRTEGAATANGGWACNQCLQEFYASCSVCGARRNTDDLMKVGDKYYCSEHKPEICTICEYVVLTDTNRYVCERCADEGCPDCIKMEHGVWACPDCRQGGDE